MVPRITPFKELAKTPFKDPKRRVFRKRPLTIRHFILETGISLLVLTIFSLKIANYADPERFQAVNDNSDDIRCCREYG